MPHGTIPDLTKSPPRPGREMLGGRYAWLARLADKIRAEKAGMLGEYIGYCRFSKAYLACVGISEQAFDTLIEQGASDEELVAFFDRNVSEERRVKANRFVLEENAAELEQQDREEGYK